MEYRAGPDLSALPFLGGAMLLVAAASVAVVFAIPGLAPSPLVLTGALTGGTGLVVIVVARTQSKKRSSTLEAKRPQRPAEWMSWLLSEPSGWWKGEVRGRPVVAQRAARRSGIGHVFVRVGASVGTRATLLARDGTHTSRARCSSARPGWISSPATRSAIPASS